MYRLKPKAEVPVIDLLAGPPGLKDPTMRHWVRKEREAFATRKVWDETSQLDVVEVAVSNHTLEFIS
jgi:E3 ubiquitin-protein ligase SHPRH